MFFEQNTIENIRVKMGKDKNRKKVYKNIGNIEVQERKKEWIGLDYRRKL